MQGGSNLILLARRIDALSKVAADCAAAHKEAGHQLGGKFATVQLDVSDRQQIANLWSRVPEDLRDVDILGMSFYLFKLSNWPINSNFKLIMLVMFLEWNMLGTLQRPTSKGCSPPMSLVSLP